MSVQQMQNFKRFKQVLFELTGFGLNPYEWRFARGFNDSEEVIRLKHKSDSDFQIAAHIHRHVNGRISLNYLYVCSL